MYYFRLNGVECKCDELSELMAVVQNENVKAEQVPDFVAWIGTAGDELNALLEKKLEKPSVMRLEQRAALAAKKLKDRKKEERKKSGFTPIERTPQELKDLPYVKTGVTWAVAKRIAKKLGRDDIAQVRSDLAQRKKLPQ